jgi:hypothetical protein
LSSYCSIESQWCALEKHSKAQLWHGHLVQCSGHSSTASCMACRSNFKPSEGFQGNHVAHLTSHPRGRPATNTGWCLLLLVVLSYTSPPVCDVADHCPAVLCSRTAPSKPWYCRAALVTRYDHRAAAELATRLLSAASHHSRTPGGCLGSETQQIINVRTLALVESRMEGQFRGKASRWQAAGTSGA